MKVAAACASVVGLASTVLTVAGSPALAASRPDLRVNAVSATHSSVPAGSTVTLRETTANSGAGHARASTTRFLLSADRTASAHDIVLATVGVQRLAAHSHRSARTSATIPAKTTAGRYHLLACADARHVVAETHEGNNCMTWSTVVRVTKAPTPAFPETPDPLQVATTLDTAKAVSSPLATSGDTVLTTRGSDGTSYTLTIPQGALIGDETITMTPVSAISGVPGAAGLAGAVQLEPHGLQLLEPAELTIVPATAVPLARQTGIAAAQGGADFHLYPLDATKAIHVSTSHFSLLGMASETQTERQAVLDRVPQRDQAQYEQASAQMLDALRQAQVDGQPDADLTRQYDELMVAYDRDIVAPLENSAETDDTWAPAAVSEGVALQHRMALLGLDTRQPFKAVFDEISSENAKILINAIRQNYTRCTQGHDLSVVSKLISFAHMAELLGVPVQNNEAWADAEKCAHLELDLHSVVTETLPGGSLAYSFTVDDQAIPISLPANFQAEGSKDPTYTAWSVYCDAGRYPQVTADGTTVTAPTEVSHVGLAYDVREIRHPDGQITREVPPPVLGLLLDPGTTNEWSVVHWSDGDRRSAGSRWDTLWRVGHASERIDPTGPYPGLYRIGDWTNGTGATLGTRTYNQTFTDGEGDWQETTTLTLRHTPQP